MTDQVPAAPTRLARKFIAYVVGFGVAVGAGTALFLGKYKIPLFEPLLVLIPEESGPFLIALSSFVMGLVALALQFYSGESISRRRVRRRFAVGVMLLLLATLTLLVLRVTCVVSYTLGGTESVSIISWSRRESLPCKCPTTISDFTCLSRYAFDTTPCWNSASVAIVKVSFYLAYLVSIGGFGGLVGLLILQEEARRQDAQRQADEEEAKEKKDSRERGEAAEAPAS